MEIITSKENRFIKEYIKLASSKKQRAQTDFFVIEGIKLIEEAFIQSIPFEMIFVTKSCFEKHSARANLAKAFQAVRTALICEEISSKLSEQISPQGVFAIVKKLDKNLEAETVYKGGCYVFLCDLQDPGNVGTIIRTAEALGIDGIIMTSSCCDPYSPKVIRGSMGSSLRVPIMIVDNACATILMLKENNVFTYASVVSPTLTDVREINFKTPSVMLIGNEGNGLPAELQCLCDSLVTIKMSGKAESLNASMAACILMWEML